MGLNITGKPKQSSASGSGGGMPSFLKKGAEGQQMLQEEEAKAELRREQAGKLRRFWIGRENVNKDFRITFLDGGLTADGQLDCVMWKEHTVRFQGNWENFIAVDESEGPDPISEFNDGKDPQFVFGLTIIDHSEWKSKKDGKVFKDQRKLFVGKRKTLGVLTKLAQKRGASGLIGCTFDVTRTNDDAPNVGDMFDFVAQNSLEDLATEYGEETASPADWGKELIYHGRDKLLEMGFGPKSGGGQVGGKGPSKDYSQEM